MRQKGLKQTVGSSTERGKDVFAEIGVYTALDIFELENATGKNSTYEGFGHFRVRAGLQLVSFG